MSERKVSIQEIFEERCGVSVLIWNYAISTKAIEMWRKEMKKLNYKGSQLVPLPYPIARKMCEKFLKRYLQIQKDIMNLEISYISEQLNDATYMPSEKFVKDFIKQTTSELEGRSYLKNFTK